MRESREKLMPQSGPKTREPTSLVFDPWHMLAFGLGSGLAPKAPGTVGTAAAVLAYLAMGDMNLYAYLSVIVLGIVVGVWLCGRTARALGCHDHGSIVWDEWVGFWVTMIAIPSTVTNILLGFLLFRFFDIIKPWPIGWLDKHIHGGAGIMVDDLAAGLMACACLHAIVYFV